MYWYNSISYDEQLMLETCSETKWINKYMKKCIRLVINKNLWPDARSTKYKILWATKFCIVVLNICGSSILKFLRISILDTKYFEGAPKFLENLSTPVVYYICIRTVKTNILATELPTRHTGRTQWIFSELHSAHPWHTQTVSLLLFATFM